MYLGLRGNYGNSDTCDISVYGIQIENNTFATSIIPTSGSTETRDTETASGSGDTTLINSEEGVFYVEAAVFEGQGGFKRISLSDGTSSKRLHFTFDNDVDVQVLAFESPSTVHFSKSVAFISRFLFVIEILFSLTGPAADITISLYLFLELILCSASKISSFVSTLIF